MIDYVVAAEVGAEKYRNKIEEPIQYGTAGFRTRAELLDHVVFRMGILAVLRSRVTKATIGLMITASHNPECDNGLKLIDPLGEMLAERWEELATKVANASDTELKNVLAEIVKSEKIDSSYKGSVFIGSDTRPSSPHLTQAAIDGVKAISGDAKDCGIVTTPMLHFFVCSHNTNGEYGDTEEGYFAKLGVSFRRLIGDNSSNGSYVPHVLFDGANGVGAIKMKKLQCYLDQKLIVEIFNDGSGKLNYLCGADYVKVSQCPPAEVPVHAGIRCASVDGDADRLVYYYEDDVNTFCLLDGDKIATLVAGHLQELVKKSKLELGVGIVQTAYANGSATEYIKNTLKVPVACVRTGVKHLHHHAKRFDIGVYFEANGHGTVLFSETATVVITRAAYDLSVTEEERLAAARLNDLMTLINQTVGDALSDILLVEAILNGKGWSIKDWYEQYKDLPNRQLKVIVKDRRIIETADEDRLCISPPGLQDTINKIVCQFKNGRSFVRSSGTEDVVRVYAEADTQENADYLAALVGKAVHQLAGGVGDVPELPKSVPGGIIFPQC